MSGGVGLDTDSGTAWISQGFERLIDRVRRVPGVQAAGALRTCTSTC